ncbi:MAG: ABC transporter substrate-binding protein [Candidatus Paceibacterota bacterium]|jgi:branched-chain amino acid transport system substrate-binding protein
MSKTYKYLIAIIVIIIIIAGIWYLGAKPTTPVATGPIKIGWIGALTGGAADYGINMKLAVELGAEEINGAGGINGRKVEIISEDGKCDPAVAVTAAQKLIDIDKVQAIITGACSSETLAIAPIAEKNKIVVVAPGSSAPALTIAGDYIFRDYPSDNYQGNLAADYVYNNLKVKKVALLSCQNDYCAGIKKVFGDKLASLGGKIVADEEFPMGSADLKTQLTKIKGTNPDLVYFIAYPTESIVGLKQIKQLNIKAKIMGADGWVDDKIYKGAGSAAENILFTVPVSPTNKKLEVAMAGKTGKTGAVTIGVPQSYDAISILIKVIKDVGYDGTSIKNALYTIKDYPGTSGSISFDSNGDLVKADYVIKTVENGQAIAVK